MMTNDKRVPLISATGSTPYKIVAQTVAGRLGRSLLN
jgi:aldehyde dehydrogenase (NAD+)